MAVGTAGLGQRVDSISGHVKFGSVFGASRDIGYSSEM